MESPRRGKSASAPASALLALAVRILVTGGCGFIGSNFIRYILQHYKPASVTNVDALTYAGNLANLDGVVEEHGERYEFFKADIANADAMDALMLEHQFFAVVISRPSRMSTVASTRRRISFTPTSSARAFF